MTDQVSTHPLRQLLIEHSQRDQTQLKHYKVSPTTSTWCPKCFRNYLDDFDIEIDAFNKVEALVVLFDYMHEMMQINDHPEFVYAKLAEQLMGYRLYDAHHNFIDNFESKIQLLVQFKECVLLSNQSCNNNYVLK